MTPSGAPPMPMQQIDTGLLLRHRNGRRDVAVADKADAGAGVADFRDQIRVARAVEDNDHEIAHLLLSAFATAWRFHVASS